MFGGKSWAGLVVFEGLERRKLMMRLIAAGLFYVASLAHGHAVVTARDVVLAPKDVGAAVQSDGAAAVAGRLTQTRRWPAMAAAIGRGEPGVMVHLPDLFHYAPPGQVGMLQAALRARLPRAPVEVLGVLDPMTKGVFSGRAVCAGGGVGWRRAAVQAILPTHDVVHALQRMDCLRALGVANPG